MKKKEIIILGCILGAILIAILIFTIQNKKKEDPFYEEEDIIIESEEENPHLITITVTGELIIDVLKIKIPYGYSYGNIVPYLKKYANDYSILKIDTYTRYFEDTEIIISSKDVGRDTSTDLEKKININTATKEELISLYGIGEKRAEKIIEYRKNKKITSFDELKKVIGVSNAVMEEIKRKAVL